MGVSVNVCTYCYGLVVPRWSRIAWYFLGVARCDFIEGGREKEGGKERGRRREGGRGGKSK